MKSQRKYSVFAFIALGFLVIGLFALIPKSEQAQLDAVESALSLISAANSGDYGEFRSQTIEPYVWNRDMAVEFAILNTIWPASPGGEWSTIDWTGNRKLVLPSPGRSGSPGLLYSTEESGVYKWIPGPGAIWYAEQLERGGYVQNIELLSWHSVFRVASGANPAKARPEASPTAYGFDDDDAVVGVALRGYYTNTVVNTNDIFVVSGGRRVDADVVFSNLPIESDGQVEIFNAPDGRLGTLEIGIAFPKTTLDDDGDLLLNLAVTLVESSVTGYIVANLDRDQFTDIVIDYR